MKPEQRTYSRRNLLRLGTGGTVIAGLGIAGINASCGGKDNSQAVASPRKTNILETSTPFKPADISTSIPTKEPTPTPKPESNVPTYEQYTSIKELPFSSAEISDIETLTKGCVPMIISDLGILCIEQSRIDGPTQLKINYQNESVNQAHLQSVLLNTNTYPDALERWNMFIQKDKYNAWKTQTGSSLTFEQWQAEEKQNVKHLFTQRAFNGTGDQQSEFKLYPRFMIYILKGNDDRSDVLGSTAPLEEYSNEVLGDILMTGMYTPDFAWFGHKDSAGNDKSQYEIAGDLALMAAQHGLDASNIVGQQYSYALQFQKILPALWDMYQELVPNMPSDINKPAPLGQKDIFTVKGDPLP